MASTDRIRTVVNEVLGKSKPPPSEPDPTYPENQLLTGPPGSGDDDLYLQPSGGFGSRAADRAELERQKREQRKLEAKREARRSELSDSPALLLSQRLASIEERLAAIETTLRDRAQ
jgi:hypothetical protein